MRLQAFFDGNYFAALHLDIEGGDQIQFEPRSEAKGLLRRALTNYYDMLSRLALEEAELMRRWNVSTNRVQAPVACTEPR